MITTINEFRKINENNSTHVDLKSYDFKSLFNKINQECFNNELPQIPINLVKSKTFTGQFSAMYYRKENKMKPVQIKISQLFHMNEEKLKNILAHEMIHYWVAIQYPYEARTKHHGPQFYANMRRINNLNLGYNITLKDDEAGELNMDTVSSTKTKLFIHGLRGTKEVYILTPIEIYDPIKIHKLLDYFNVSQVQYYTTTSPHSSALTTTRSIKLQALNDPKYNYLLHNVINDTKHTQIKND